MAQALTPPFLVAALVLGIAGLAKLRAPTSAARALSGVVVPVGAAAIRLFALLELALCAWCVVAPGRAAAGALAAVYGLFTALIVALVRRGAACGCFGAAEAPASIVQALLNGALAVVALLAVITPAHGLGWVLGRPVPQASTLLIGVLAAAYGAVVAYTEMPSAWTSWSAG